MKITLLPKSCRNKIASKYNKIFSFFEDFMKAAKMIFLITVFVFIKSPGLFAKDWFICLGSFEVASNAEQFKDSLAAQFVPSFVYKTENAGKTLYQVLLLEPFSDADDARNLRNGIEKPLKKHIAINGGLWICLADQPYHAEPELRMIHITDSDTGNPIALARLTVDETLHTATNEDGDAELPDGLSDGNHSLFIESEGHIATKTHFSTTGGAVQTPPVYSVARAVEGEGGSIKVVLNWGYLPPDLDLHVFSGSRHVYFSSMHSSGVDVIDLDRDDTDYEGPETITVHNRSEEAVYKFYIHDYSNGSNPSSTALSRSGARVQLAIDNVDVDTYSVPTEKAGIWWHVFDIEKGNSVVVYNTVSEYRE